MSQQIGFAAENMAKKYLVKQGLKYIASNYKSKLGEIDLIMQDRDCLVFVEVKSRKSAAFGHAESYVTQSKQTKIIKTAFLYLQAKHYNHNHPFRFDVLSISGENHQVNWIANAFGTDY